MFICESIGWMTRCSSLIINSSSIIVDNVYKLRKQQAMEEARKQAEQEAKTSVDWRKIEQDAVRELLAQDHLRVHEVDF